MWFFFKTEKFSTSKKYFFEYFFENFKIHAFQKNKFANKYFFEVENFPVLKINSLRLILFIFKLCFETDKWTVINSVVE